MADALDTSAALARWRANPVAFIEEVLIDPETDKPFVLLLAERVFLEHAFERDDTGRLRYPELIFSAPKKSGKTTLAALFVITILLLFGGVIPRPSAAQMILSRVLVAFFRWSSAL